MRPWVSFCLLLAAPAGAAPVAERVTRAAAQLATVTAEAPAAPQSGCAGLPESGPVAEPGATETVAATLTADRRFECPDGFRLDALARLPSCSRPGIKVVDGNPRAACLAAMQLGPLAALAPRHRPTRSCGVPVRTTILRLTGANVGWGDVGLTVVPDTGITATTLTATGPEVAQDENPVLQRCFAGDCRLVKLEIRGHAAPAVEVRLAVPGATTDPTAQRLVLVAECRDNDSRAVREGVR